MIHLIHATASPTDRGRAPGVLPMSAEDRAFWALRAGTKSEGWGGTRKRGWIARVLGGAK